MKCRVINKFMKYQMYFMWISDLQLLQGLNMKCKNSHPTIYAFNNEEVSVIIFSYSGNLAI